MKEELQEAEQFEADFAAAGEMECDELEETDADFELEQLAARMQAARSWGA